MKYCRQVDHFLVFSQLDNSRRRLLSENHTQLIISSGEITGMYVLRLRLSLGRVNLPGALVSPKM